MRPLALTAAATITVFALGCAGGEALPTSPTEAAPEQPDGATGGVSSPQVYFIQTET